jgi:malate dehydrogenase
MNEIGIIGSGNVGANIAFFIAEKGVADVCLYDVKDGVSQGKSLDMMEAAPIRRYKTKIRGTDSFQEARSKDIVIITAGSVRSPGMKREDLFEQNRALITELAASFKGSESTVILVTEPVDLLTTLFVQESGMNENRVMGLGSYLDSTRLRYLLAKELGISPESVDATVIGRHSDDMIPLPDYCAVAGVPVKHLIEPERLESIFAETRGAGALIVDMAQRASAYYGPSAVAAELAEAILKDLKRTIPVSIMFTGQYGIRGAAMSLPAVIGAGGVVRVLEPRLTDEQKEKLTESAEAVRRVVEGGR